MCLKNGCSDGNSLLCILLRIVVIRSNILPVREVLFNISLSGYLPGVLISYSCLRIVPAVFNCILLRIFASLCQGICTHIYQHLAQNFRSTLRYHQAAGSIRNIRIPGSYGYTAGNRICKSRIQTGSIYRRNTDSIHARCNGIIDYLNLICNRCIRGSLIIYSKAPLLSILLRTVVSGFKECVSGQFRNECNVQSFNGFYITG